MIDSRQIRAKITYDAKKLSQNIPKMIQELLKDYTTETGEQAKKNISQGRVKPDIGATTKKIRKSRGYPESPPLLASGKLLKSIKTIELKNGAKIRMNLYGALHNKGYNTAPNSMIPRKKVPKREFIKPKKGTIQKLLKEFGKEMARSFKKDTSLRIK